MQRLDQLLVENGLVSNRTRAGKLIADGKVLVDGKVVSKSGRKFTPEVQIELTEEELPWVSRGALKLLAGLEHWQVDVSGKVAVDVGSSTGGFTEVLLDRGISKVYAIDSGSDQLAEKIRNDERVVVMEKTNFRHFDSSGITPKPEIAVMDVSFISQTLLYPSLLSFLGDEGLVISLVKPQFEAGPERIGKNGLVRDDETRQTILNEVRNKAMDEGFDILGVIDSPISGGDGNKEFLMYMKKK